MDYPPKICYFCHIKNGHSSQLKSLSKITHVNLINMQDQNIKNIFPSITFAKPSPQKVAFNERAYTASTSSFSSEMQFAIAAKG